MKALIILADNVYLTPYLQFYKSILDKQKIDHDIVYWDKNNNEDINDFQFFRFVYEGKGKIGKVFGYFRYRKFIISLIKKQQYDFLIPLHAIIYLLLFNLLNQKYKKRYIFDVRDYSYEKISVYKWMQKKLVSNSIINIISSKGYEEFLPKSEYFVTHNIPYGNYEKYKQLENTKNEVIQISYIGLIRFMEQNKKILFYFKNDNRFHLNFIGTNAKQLEEFCLENSIRNVTLIDTFDSKKTLEFYKKTDLIMNLYGNHTPLLDYALSNKLYYAACLYKPILVCEDTYMEKISMEYNIGYTLKMKNDEEKDKLYSYITQLDRKKLIENCDKFMKDVYEDKNILEKIMLKRIQEIKDKVKS
ncbi:capsular biosynthesis protein [Massilimicrobiota timonensis]|uniref:capsular biosynthesis protein n=1 Tax=Massilimicrobiota timonensis TaxID=1776392 RepID=UPI001A912A6D|nr:capsular biosynthesis protein [Massilimicrobiota timonensis]